MFSIQTRAVGPVNVVRCSGSFVLGRETEVLTQSVPGLLERGGPVILNLKDVVTIDTSGIGTLLLLHCWIHAAGSRISFCCLSPRISEMLRITNLSEVFDIRSDEQEAISAVAAVPASVASVA